MKIRADKYISDMTSYSRSEVKKLFKYRKVKINGQVEQKSGAILDVEKDQMEVLDKILTYEKDYVLVMNKPSGYITATEDPHQETVMDLLPFPYKKNAFPIGRLDKDTEGLLLFTDDGQLAHQLLSPKKEVEKEYYMTLRDEFTDEMKAVLENEITFKDFTAKPGKVEVLGEAEISLTITEGKFHQVKRMVAAAGNEVIYLKRVRFGDFRLPNDLELGQWRKLTKEETGRLIKNRAD